MRGLGPGEIAVPGAALIFDLGVDACGPARRARTVNVPPGWPLAECAMALVHSSLVSRIASSAPGQPRRNAAIKTRARRTWLGRPGKVCSQVGAVTGGVVCWRMGDPPRLPTWRLEW